MDTEERHELKENDLAEMLRNFGDWFNEHGTKVLLVLVIVVGTFTGYNFYTTSVEQRYEAAWADLAAANTPENFLAVARSHDEPTVQTLAYLRGADLYRRRAIDRYEPMEDAAVENRIGEQATEANAPESNNDTEGPSPEADLEQAAAMYRRVLEQDPEHTDTIYRVNALIGLGAVAESRKAWDEAAEQYQRASELAGEPLEPLARQARRRLDLLDDLRRPIVFGPEREPEEQMGPLEHLPEDALEGLELETELPEDVEAPPTEAPPMELPEAPGDEGDDGPESEQEMDLDVQIDPETLPDPPRSEDAPDEP